MSYTFRHSNGDLTTVEADNEAKARDLAMLKKYGQPDGRVILRRPYVGYGLTLVSQE